MSSNTKASDFHSDSSAKKDYEIQQGSDKNKHEKTTLTFEKKKVSETDKDLKDMHKQDKEMLDVHKDKDMKDLHKDKDMKDVHKDKDIKDVSSKHETHSEGGAKGIINTIKEKVRDVLGPSDKEKDIEKNKDLEHKNLVGTDAAAGSKYQSNLGASDVQQQHYTGLGSSSDQQHTALGATGSTDKDKYSNFGASSGQHTATVGINTSSDKDKYSNLGSSSSSSGQYGAGVGVSTSSDKYSSGQHSSNLASDKYSSSATQPKPVTVDRTGLGAEHREVGYDKQANVITSKNFDKEKDIGHKVDIHATVKTGDAAGSTSGSQASTYKTTESK